MKKLLATSCVLLATVAAVTISVETERIRGRKEAALAQAKATVLAQTES
jgi:hypothetical protein